MTRTQRLLAVAEKLAPGSRLVDELRNRHARGTGGNLEGFINKMYSKHVEAPKAAQSKKDCEPVVKDAFSGLQKDLIAAINKAFQTAAA